MGSELSEKNVISRCPGYNAIKYSVTDSSSVFNVSQLYSSKGLTYPNVSFLSSSSQCGTLYLLKGYVRLCEHIVFASQRYKQALPYVI